MCVWRADRSISANSARQYLQWIGQFRRYCSERGLVEVDELTRDGAKRFKVWYARSHKIKVANLGLASSSMRALRRVYEVMGAAVPAWSPIKRRPSPAMALLRDYAAHLGQHRGNPEGTIHKKLDHVGKLLEHLARRGKSWRRMRLTDVDAFLIECAGRYARSTTADIASTVRSFARFLLASGRVHVDLADAVIAPVQPRFEQPRRALPWDEVQQLLRAVDTSTARGLRDHAMLLMMSAYGLGAGEVIRLRPRQRGHNRSIHHDQPADETRRHASVLEDGRHRASEHQAMEAEGQPPGVLAVLVSDSYAEHAAAPVRMCVAASVHYSR